MSTIKSSNEHLTLNADGSSKDIKFQANGVEKASISSAGAFTSTTIDATKLTGTIPNFTSTGIDDNADATAITITSAENVGIGTTAPDAGSVMTIAHPGSGSYGLRLQSTQNSGTQYHLTIYRDTTHAGYLVSNANQTLTLVNASDERLKENIVDSGSATQSIKDLKVRKFNWKNNPSNTIDFGFVAQEMIGAVPEAVIQGNDETDDNGNYKLTWGVGYADLVPRLVKTIQELEARIAALEA